MPHSAMEDINLTTQVHIVLGDCTNQFKMFFECCVTFLWKVMLAGVILLYNKTSLHVIVFGYTCARWYIVGFYGIYLRKSSVET